MSNWNHKGFDITMQGASFVTQLPGKRVLAPSLKAVQKAIDKHLETKALAVELNLPVVFFRSPRAGYHGADRAKGEVVRGAISGIDPEEMKILGVESTKESINEFFLPDSEQNAKLLSDLIAAERAYSALQKMVKDRTVSIYLGTHHRSKPVYADCIARLQRNYDEAVKGEA